jgi:CRP-like cAMP-binding protein
MILSNVSHPIDFNALQQVPLFQGLQPENLERICAAGDFRTLPKDGFFFLQGDLAESIYVLLSGRARMTQSSPDGQQVLLRAIGPYSLFGAVAMAQTETYPVTAEASEESTALHWTKLSLMPFVSTYPLLAMNAMQMMSVHAQEFQERFRQLATERVERRLARTLLRLAAQTGKKIPEGVLIDLPLTRQDLAEMTGTTLYTVSRLLSSWEDQGFVISGRERVTIRYPHGLVSIADDLPLK